MIAYSNSGEVRLAYADPAAATPTWTSTSALTQPGYSYGLQTGGADIDVDEYDFASYYVYVVALARNPVGEEEVWFTRSTKSGHVVRESVSNLRPRRGSG